jgi:hypothetical protein
MNFLDKEAGIPSRQGLMPAAGQNRLFEERYPAQQEKLRQRQRAVLAFLSKRHDP